MDAQVTVGAEDGRVAAKPRRRTYTAEDKRRILKEADACTTPGAVGALLRREGLYSSRLVVWRRARGRGEPGQEVLVALAGVAPHDAAHRRIRLQPRRVDRHRGMIRGRGLEAEPHKAAYRERIRRAPGDATLRVQPLEVAEQRQPEVPPRRQAGSPHHRSVERSTLLLREPVKPGLVEDGVQPDVE